VERPRAALVVTDQKDAARLGPQPIPSHHSHSPVEVKILREAFKFKIILLQLIDKSVLPADFEK